MPLPYYNIALFCKGMFLCHAIVMAIAPTFPPYHTIILPYFAKECFFVISFGLPPPPSPPPFKIALQPLRLIVVVLVILIDIQIYMHIVKYLQY